jgi:4-amino-4-deoxy-L-arabinose transferase-like glycosyltransferase
MVTAPNFANVQPKKQPMNHQPYQTGDNTAEHFGPPLPHYVPVLIFVAVAVLLPGMFGVSLFDRDEGWYAQVAREMVLSGDWLVPRYLGEIWLAKPPLLYWLVGGSFELFGIGTWQARLVPVLFSVVNVVLIGRLASEMFDRRIALYSGLLFITAGLPALVGKMVLTDAPLLTCILLAVLFHWRIAHAGCTLGRTIACGVAVGLGALAKGPAIFLFAGSFALGMMLTRYRHNWLTVPKFYLCIPIALGIAAPWYVYIWQVAGPQLTEQFIGYEIISRFTDAPHGHTGPPGYHLLIALVGLLPWTGLVYLGIKNAYNNRKENERNIILLIWWIVPWLVLELIRSKLPHYTFPCYVPLAITAAPLLNMALDHKATMIPLARKVRYLLSRGSLFLAGIGGALFLAAVFELTSPVRTPGAICATLMITGFAAAASLGRRSSTVNFSAMVATTVALHITVGFVLLPSLEPLRLNHTIAERLNELHQADEKIYLVDYEEPTVFFYLDCPASQIHRSRLKQLLRSNSTRSATTQPTGTSLLAIPADKQRKLDQRIQKQLRNSKKLAEITGINIARMEKQTIHIYRLQTSAALNSSP